MAFEEALAVFCVTPDQPLAEAGREKKLTLFLHIRAPFRILFF